MNYKKSSIKTTRLLLATGVLLTVVFSLTMVAAQANAITTSFNFPIDRVFYPDCTNAPHDQSIHLTGFVHEVAQTISDNNGGYRLKVQFNPQGVVGVGFPSGFQYQGTGVTDRQTTVKAGQITTFVNNFDLIARGPGYNYIDQEIAHTTVNPDGTVTTTFDNIRILCR